MADKQRSLCIFDFRIKFAILHKKFEAFALSLVLKRRKFQMSRDKRLNAHATRGLSYCGRASDGLRAVSGVPRFFCVFLEPAF